MAEVNKVEIQHSKQMSRLQHHLQELDETKDRCAALEKQLSGTSWAQEIRSEVKPNIIEPTTRNQTGGVVVLHKNPQLVRYQ